MTGTVLGIVLVAAFLHAFWNYLTKKSRNKIAFIWWAILFSVILFFPMFLYYWPAVTISSAGWSCIVATGILHAFYFWFMGGAYERGIYLWFIRSHGAQGLCLCQFWLCYF